MKMLGRSAGKSGRPLVVSHLLILSFHLLKNICDFALLVLKGIYHYWKYVFFSRGLKQMEVSQLACSLLYYIYV